MAILKRTRTSTGKGNGQKKRKIVYSSTQNLIGKSNLREVKCKDQIFAPDTIVSMVKVAATVFVAPTVAGAGLATGYSLVNGIQQGNGPSQRVGDKVVVKSVSVKINIQQDDAQDITDEGQVRMMLVYDKSPNGTAPGVADVIANLNSDGSYATAFNSGIKMSNKKRFVMLRDKIYNLGISGPGTRAVKFFVKKRMETIYSGTADPPAIAQVISGAIYLFIFCSGGYTHNPTLHDVNCRIRYYD